MSNISSANLHQLITSLSKTEKRYFKLNTLRRNGEKTNVFETLFNAIERQKEPDKIALPVVEKGIPHLSMIKKRLFEMILKSMETYHLENSLENKLRSTVNKIEFLFHKGLNEPCAKLINRAKKVAIENELWEQLIEILNLESLLLAAYDKSIYADKTRLKIHDEAVFALHQLKNRLDYLKLSIRITEIGKGSQTIRKKHNIKQLNSILADPLLKSDKAALSLKAKSTYYFLLSRGALLRSKPQEGFQYVHEYVKFSTPKKDPSLASILTYFNSLGGYLQHCLIQKNYKEGELAVMKMKSIPFQFNIRGSDFLQSSIYTMSTGNLFTIYIDTGEFNKALALIKEVEDNKTTIEKNLSGSNKIILSFYFFYTYFGLEKYKLAMAWLNNTIESITKTGLREDMYSLSKILILVVHYELGHHDLLSYIVKSAFRNLNNLNELHQFESIMLDFFNKKLPEANSAKERIELFKDLKNKLEKLTSPSEKRIMQDFDFVSWVDSKIEKLPFAQIVKKKSKGYSAT